MNLDELSRATEPERPISIPRLSTAEHLKPYQEAAVAYATATRRTVIGDEMGLGKTLEALATASVLDAFPLIVICPAFLRLTWQKQIRRFFPSLETRIIDERGNGNGLGEPITIISYALAGEYAPALVKMKPRGIIFDESHFLKNRKADRTIAARRISEHAEVRLAISGTPIQTRPRDLVSQLEILGQLDNFGGAWFFLQHFCNPLGANVREPCKYCGATGTNRRGQKCRVCHGRRGLWNFDGLQNGEELNRRLRRRCYVRRLKSEVQKDLPPKSEATIYLPLANREAYRHAERDIEGYLRAAKGADAAARAARAPALVKVSALETLAIEGKMEAIYAWIENFLDSGSKLAVFGLHIATVRALGAKFGAPVIYGDTPMDKREKLVEQFQADPATRLIVLNIESGGVGIELTAASDVAIVEDWWVPSTHEQAVSRVHREGQTKPVTVWNLIAEDTIDEMIAQVREERAAMIEVAVEGTGAAYIPEDAETAADVLRRRGLSAS